MIRDKGYGTGNGSHLVNFANPQESTLVQQGRAGKESPTGGPISVWDYIPSKNTFPYLSDQQIVGATSRFSSLAGSCRVAECPCYSTVTRLLDQIIPTYALAAIPSRRRGTD